MSGPQVVREIHAALAAANLTPAEQPNLTRGPHGRSAAGRKAWQTTSERGTG